MRELEVAIAEEEDFERKNRFIAIDMRRNGITPMYTDPNIVDYLLDSKTRGAISVGREIGNVCKSMLGRFGGGLAVRGEMGCLIEEINFADDTMDDVGCEVMARIFKAGACANMERIILEDSGIGPLGFKHMGSIIPDLKKLQLLDLSDNNVEDDGVSALMDALTRSSVEKLDLSSCGFTDKGAKILADGIAKTNLKCIQLNNAQFGEAGVSALTKAIQRLDGSQLCEFEMKDHDIRGPAIDPALMTALEEACSAKDIKFTWSSPKQRLEGFGISGPMVL